MQHALKCWNFVDCGIFPCFIFPFRDKNLKWWGNISELRRHYNYDFATSWPIRVADYGRDAGQSAAGILGGKRGKMVLGKLSGARLSCGDAVESFSRRMDIGGKVALWKSVSGCNYLWFVPQGGYHLRPRYRQTFHQASWACPTRLMGQEFCRWRSMMAFPTE